MELYGLALFQDRINGVATDAGVHGLASMPTIAYAINGGEMLMLGRANYPGTDGQGVAYARGDVLIEHSRFAPEAAGDADLECETRVLLGGDLDGLDPGRIAQDGVAWLAGHEQTRYWDGPADQAGVVEHPWVETSEGVVAQVGDARLRASDGTLLPYGWADARDHMLEHLEATDPQLARATLMQDDLNQTDLPTAWFVEANGYDLHKFTWYPDAAGELSTVAFEHLQYVDHASMAPDDIPDSAGDPPVLDSIAHSDEERVEQPPATPEQIVEQSRRLLDAYQAQRDRDSGPEAAGLEHPISQSGLTHAHHLGYPPAIGEEARLHTSDGRAALDLQDARDHYAGSRILLVNDLRRAMEQPRQKLDEPEAVASEETPAATMRAQRSAPWPRVSFPRQFVRPFTRQARSGRSYDMLTVTIPKGVRINGVDLGGWHFDRFAHRQEREDLVNHRPVTVSFRPGEHVELWRGAGEQRDTLSISEPWDLCRAVKTQRDAYQQAHEQTRRQESAEPQPDDQSFRDQADHPASAEKPETAQAEEPDEGPLTDGEAAASIARAVIEDYDLAHGHAEAFITNGALHAVMEGPRVIIDEAVIPLDEAATRENIIAGMAARLQDARFEERWAQDAAQQGPKVAEFVDALRSDHAFLEAAAGRMLQDLQVERRARTTDAAAEGHDPQPSGDTDHMARELLLYVENSEALSAEAARIATLPAGEAGQAAQALADRAALDYAHDPDFCGIAAETPDDTPFDAAARQAMSKLLHEPAAPAIDEQAAQEANRARSTDGYQTGNATREYDRAVSEIRQLAEERKQQTDPSFHERIDRLADRYAALLAAQTNDFNRRSSQIPSMMVTGPANYPTARMAKRTDSMMRHTVEQQTRLDRLRERIETIGDTPRGISSTQSDAEQLLADKLDKLEARQAEMKQANKQARANNEPAPYESFTLSNNNANMRRIRQRIEGIQRRKAAGSSEQSGTAPAGEPFTLSRDGEAGYVSFTFQDKPSADTRDLLKHHGFHWSPKASRWQRKMTGSADYAVRSILEQCETSPAPDAPAEHERRQHRHGAR